ncbi:MAG: hypothetical protein ABIH83_05780 [Candidatus Micrarchaeota archaeon]
MRKKKFSILHYPRLDTVLMIENFIRKHSGEFKKTQLWKKLPRKTMYQTYNTVLGYLADSSKISIDSKGKIGWIYNPALAKKFLSKGVVVK